MPQLLRLWWSWTSSEVTGSPAPTVRVSPPLQSWSGQATAGAFEAYAAEQRGGQAGSVEADDESYSDGLERYVRAACVSLSRSESSHENAHLRLLRIAWGGYAILSSAHSGRWALCAAEVCRHRSKHSASSAAPHIHQLRW